MHLNNETNHVLWGMQAGFIYKDNDKYQLLYIQLIIKN